MADQVDTTAQRVWVVDDDRAVRFVLCTALREAGYRVEGFDGAAAALAMLAEQAPPDLLFTDVRMPGDDGLVLLDKLKAAHPQLPVIVMSGHAEMDDVSDMLRLQVLDLFRKPIYLVRLIDTLNSLFPLSKAR